MENIELKVACPGCNKTSYLVLDRAAYINWQENDVLIQNAFPDLTPTERETLISGLCPKCQKEFFGDGDYEDDDE